MLSYSCFWDKTFPLSISHFPVPCACAQIRAMWCSIKSLDLGLSHVILANLLHPFHHYFSHVKWRKCYFLGWLRRLGGTMHLQFLQHDGSGSQELLVPFPPPSLLVELAAPGWVLTILGCAWVQWCSLGWEVRCSIRGLLMLYFVPF